MATPADIGGAVDAVWRIESAKLIAGLHRIVGDVGQAEDLAQDALVAALERWPESGIPDNPGAWLMATAKHRAIDRLRRRKLVARPQDGRAGARQGGAGADRAGSGPPPRRRRRRRPAAADVLGVPSGAVHRSAR